MDLSGSSLGHAGARTLSQPLLPPTSMKTKIVCTLGPASIPKLEALVKAGMDVCRLNFSHGTHEQHRSTFADVRAISAKFSHQVAVMCDIQGPKIRTGRMAAPFVVAIGDKVKVTPDKVVGSPELFQIKYASMLEDLGAGDTIFITDGTIKLRVESCNKEERHLLCEVEAGGLLSDHKGCNIPSGNISLDVLQPKDREDLVLIAELDPEYVAASFVGTAEDVRKIRKVLHELGNDSIKIIAKVERPVALENLDSIIEAADGIMVARGDLGVEIDTWDVPFAQKMIVSRCNKEGKPVIVATQMLETMTSVPRPTRAEASDVYNAVLDGADAVMLSGETSIGKYPVQAVQVMDRIVERAELSMPRRNPDDFDSSHQAVLETAGHGVYTLAKEFIDIGYTGCILIISNSPDSTRMVSKYRPMLGTILLSNNIRTVREMALFWGVRGIFEKGLVGDLETRVSTGISICVEAGLLKRKDHVIVVIDSTIPSIGGHLPGIFTGIFSVDRVVSGSDGTK